MAAFTAIAGATMALGSAVSSGIQAGKMRRQASDRAAELRNLEANRQDIINPYADIKDLSGMITNPFANLQVATKAAEMQAEEADISLASTLDTLRATGAGSAGATALAQAALRSKKGIAASIEQQEAQNERLRAQGEMNAMNQRIQEQRRIQGIDISEAQRVQQAEAQGLAFQFQAQEQRDQNKIDRLYGEMRTNQMQQLQSSADMTGAIAGAFGGAAQVFASPLGEQIFPG